MIKAAIFCDRQGNLDNVYKMGRLEMVSSMTDLYPHVITTQNFDDHEKALKDIEVVFSTWGMPLLKEEQIDKLKSLKALFYAAGSVKAFAKPYIQKGITVMSAWAANAVPVAEFTLAQILLSTKGYFRNTSDRKCLRGQSNTLLFKGPGNFGETISLLGCGMVGRKLIELLKGFNLHVIVYDPYLKDETANMLGVEKVSLEDAFTKGYVVSNHTPDIPATKGLITGRLFELMREHATFINTGRGATVVENDMIAVLKKRPSLTALLDVTWPEPPPADSEIYTMPNVILSGHIAGSLGDETVRMADYCIEQFKAYAKGAKMKYTVNLEDLDKMA